MKWKTTDYRNNAALKLSTDLIWPTGVKKSKKDKKINVLYVLYVIILIMIDNIETLTSKKFRNI